MTKAERRAEKLQRHCQRQRRERLKDEARRREAVRAAEQAAARTGPPRWLTMIPGPTAEELGIVQCSRDTGLTS
jgi:hypothetical protein